MPALDRMVAEYLAVSGATAIILVERGGCADIRVGRPRNLNDVDGQNTFWLPENVATSLARDAKKRAGKRPTCARLSSALREAANECNIALTPHCTAIERASRLTVQLTERMAHLRNAGALRQFNLLYQDRRKAASEAGRGFMTYSQASARLRRAIIARLVGAAGDGRPSSLLAEVFRDDGASSEDVSVSNHSG